jgi:hypothetical protein
LDFSVNAASFSSLVIASFLSQLVVGSRQQSVFDGGVDPRPREHGDRVLDDFDQIFQFSLAAINEEVVLFPQ